jgi:tRNA A-37 threonylcarbamoyl transferase component Bud32
VPQTSLEQALRDLPTLGRLVKDRGYRQVWRFEHDDRAYYLKFYPRSGMRDRWRRMFRGSPASREFFRLQWLQKAAISAPRAVALMSGFTLQGRGGDAVILEAIEPSCTLDELLEQHELEGRSVPNHRQLADQLIALVAALAKAGLGHDDLHLGNFLVRDDTLYLIDAYAIRAGGLKLADILHLGASVTRFATTADILRGWRRLVGPGKSPPPQNNPVSRKLWRMAMDRARGNNRYVGHLDIDGWHGVYFRHTKHPRRWSAASRLTVEEQDWRQAWPLILQRIESGAMTPLKHTRSVDVMADDLTIGGQTIPVVIKRPLRRYWYRYLNEIPRGARARRAWFKAWDLIVRNLPTAWPLAVFERRRLGYVVETIFICERIAGPTLWTVNLDAMPIETRELLFRRTGRILRRIDETGLSHFDAKSSNWIVREDAQCGPSPVLIDVDGVRHRRWVGLGIERLLRSLRAKRQYTPEDSLALCRGYAPYARLDEQMEAAETHDTTPAEAVEPADEPEGSPK